MKSASTDNRTEFILYDAVDGSRAHPVAKLEYMDDTGNWVELDDVTGFSFSQSNNNLQYGKTLLLPPTNSMSASIDNSRGKYSPDTGLAFDGVLKRNRKVRPSIGYVTNEALTQEYTVVPSTEYESLFHTQVIAGKIFNDIASAISRPSYLSVTDNWTYYGDLLYGAVTYNAEGLFVSDPIDMYRYNTEVLKNLKVYSDTNKITLYFRTANTTGSLAGNAIPFVVLGTCAVGENTWSLGSDVDRYIQIAAVFHTGVWSSTTGYINNIRIEYEESAEVFTQEEFLMDDPSFNSSFNSYTASFSGRDWLKKAYETAVTCPTYASGKDPALIIRDVCDRAGIPYTVTTIPATGYSVTIVDDENFKDVRAIDILNEIMQWLIYKDAEYRLFLKDGYLTLSALSDDNTTADWQIDYRRSMTNLSRGYISDRLIQRCTYVSKEQIVNPEKSIATASHTTTQTGVNLSWTSTYGAMYIRIVVTGTGTFTLNYVDLGNKKINYTSTGTVGITVYGCELKNTLDGFYGESIYYENQSNGDGFTQKIVNRLIQSSAEAKSMAEAFVSQYGNPAYQVQVTIACNPLLEIGDRVLIWEKYSNTNTVYRVDDIGVQYSADGASMMQNLRLTDLGESFGTFIWDRNGASAGAGDLLWDKGLIWDQELGPLVTEDTTNYDYLKRIQFA